MERIKLTQREKRIMRLLLGNNAGALSEFDAPSVKHLAELGLVMRAGVEGGSFDDARLTNMGKEYFNDNPRLRNPVNWTLIFAAIASVVALFISCSKLI